MLTIYEHLKETDLANVNVAGTVLLRGDEAVRRRAPYRFGPWRTGFTNHPPHTRTPGSSIFAKLRKAPSQLYRRPMLQILMLQDLGGIYYSCTRLHLWNPVWKPRLHRSNLRELREYPQHIRWFPSTFCVFCNLVAMSSLCTRLWWNFLGISQNVEGVFKSMW